MTRTLPYNLDAEASILGGIMLRNEVLAALPDLEPDDFYDHKHKVVFQAMRNLEAKMAPIDEVTLEVEIQRGGMLEAIGGPAFLGELTLRVPTADNVRAYADIVVRFHRARRMAQAAAEVVERVYTDGLDDPDEYLAASERLVLEVSQSVKHERPKHIGELVKQRFRELEQVSEARARGDVVLTGIPTGIAMLDKLIGGYPRKVPLIIAGRPKQGKSSAVMAAADAASAAGIGVMMFSLEDGREAYTDNAIARNTGVETDRLRTGNIRREDMDPLSRGVAALRKRTNWRFDERVLDAASICRELRRAKAEIPKFGLGIVDYVQLVRRNPKLNEDQALREHMAYFAAVAKELDIALVVVSQLNREVEKREDKRPTMADLRGSGSLEEVAKLILMLYRGSVYYDTAKKGVDYDCDCPDRAPCYCAPENFSRQVQIIVAANNQGPTGRVFASWNGPTKTMR